ncbi:MAG: hypothetical protein A3I61_07075 [Acidobacteria bacterium RIFCSPLOWO2_02_FULL_68_18]|nr:MAG: hypothetical protein A3I61_07075 [Acidobacteria bacterium RIFCSPLOWO2_02_FULL_68_18]OFW49214.1 MAG: hypothetical protein A3G77_03865 [Acidobacteria bacterium RIFCSPLOWO2_12_FULL_68_19]
MRLILPAVVIALAGSAPSALAQGEEGAVPIEQAPYHLPVFTNEYVTVLKIEIPPQRDTGFHTHRRDSVSVNIEPADNVSQDLGSPKVVPSQRAERGRAQFTPYGRQPPRSHKNTNVGTTPFHNVSFIFTSPAPLGVTPSSRAAVPAYASIMDNERVRGWRLVLEPGQSAAAVTQQAPGLRVVVSGGEIVEVVPGQPDRAMQLRTGEFYWQDPGVPRAVRNRGSTRVELVEFELK